MYLPKKNLSLLKKLLKVFLFIAIIFITFPIFTRSVSAQCSSHKPPGCYKWSKPGCQCRGDRKSDGTRVCSCKDDDGGGGSKPTSTPVPTPTPTPVRDASPFPGPYVPCNETRPEEFHSLRPYQASPCNQNAEDLALFCGNDFVLLDTIIIYKNFYFPPDPLIWEYIFEGNPIGSRPPSSSDYYMACSYCNQNGICASRPEPCIPDIGCEYSSANCQTECKPNGDGTETCYFNISRVRDIVIDLLGAELPIMGYTEPSINNQKDPYRVINSRFQSETVTDAQKVNEYVSWYLNGIIGRAEYDPPNPGTEEGRERVVDYSGPLKKLLSWESQIVDRIREVARAGVDRHNQIVACRDSQNRPIKCYPGSATKIRLNWWSNQGNPPPLERNYPDFNSFWIAYNNWRNTAINLPRLFSYIPFSSTEDRLGQVEIENYTIQPPSNARILYSAITNQIPADLFFAHMQESYELADLLQQTFIFQGADPEAPPEDTVVPYEPFCDVREVRRGPGDNLFPTELSATIEYTAQVQCVYTLPGEGRVCLASGGFCHTYPEYRWDCDYYFGPVDCPYGQWCGRNAVGQDCSYVSDCLGPTDVCRVGGEDIGECCTFLDCSGGEIGGTPYGKCDGDVGLTPFKFTEICSTTVPIAFKTITKTPLADEVWTRLVAGPSSVFRRLFPQIEDEPGRPIRRLWDIPAATSVIYKSLTPGVRVVAGNPASGRSGDEAELYFPHIGGIHEYFLSCIQKTLRPKGFGQGCATGPLPPQTANIGPGGGGNSGVCNVYDAGPQQGPAPSRGAACQPGAVGWCSIGTLTNEINGKRGLGWSTSQIRTAAIVCNGESGGWTNALNDGCLCGRTCDFSIGLFQINALPGRCDGTGDPDAFIAFAKANCPAPGNWSCDYASKSFCCIPKSDEAAQACIDHWVDPETNINKMITLSHNGTNWTPWSYYATCSK